MADVKLWFSSFFILYLRWICISHCIPEYVSEPSTCFGTSLGIQDHVSVDDYQTDLKDRYTDCTHVQGNLEITHIYFNSDPKSDSEFSSSDYSVSMGEDFDILFLDLIEEVSGYVLIYNVSKDVFSLRNLKRIRGESTFQGNALTVAHRADTIDGISKLLLPSLREISNGDVLLAGLPNLCYVNTIVWHDMRFGLVADITDTGSNCSPDVTCPESCPGGCWGNEDHLCQVLTLTICDDSCGNRCQGPGEDQCCHTECAVGCLGNTNADCLACKTLQTDGGECVAECPPKYTDTHMMQINPDFLYAFEDQCLEECPYYLLGEGEGCVEECSLGSMEVAGECIFCDGICPNECQGLDLHQILTGNHFYGDRFVNCTSINGNILITDSTMNGDPFQGVPPATVEELRYFQTVREVSGYVVVIFSYGVPAIADFDIFKRLETIGGKETFNLNNKLYSLVLKMDLLQSADFGALNVIEVSNVFETDTCYHTREMFVQLLVDPSNQEVIEQSRKTQCGSDVCHGQCTSIGCWGPEAYQCVECQNSIFYNGTCLEICDLDSQYISSPAMDGISEICGPCHEQCSGGCTGPSNMECNSCSNYQFGDSCVESCFQSQYVSGILCLACPDVCHQGCTGTELIIGEGGCNDCDSVLLDVEGMFVRCMEESEQCRGNHILTNYGPSTSNIYADVAVCQLCHPMCMDGCTWPGSPLTCNSCKNFKREDICVEACNTLEFVTDDKECMQCHEFCIGCFNASAQDCDECKELEVQPDIGNRICVPECPSEYPYKYLHRCLMACPEDTAIGPNMTCLTCHSHCKGGCYNSSNETACVSCMDVKLGDACIAECPEDYTNENGICKGEKTSGKERGNIKVMVLSIVLILLIVLLVAIVIVVLFIRRVQYRGLPSNEVDLKDINNVNNHAEA